MCVCVFLCVSVINITQKQLIAGTLNFVVCILIHFCTIGNEDFYEGRTNGRYTLEHTRILMYYSQQIESFVSAF